LVLATPFRDFPLRLYFADITSCLCLFLVFSSIADLIGAIAYTRQNQVCLMLEELVQGAVLADEPPPEGPHVAKDNYVMSRKQGIVVSEMARFAASGQYSVEGFCKPVLIFKEPLALVGQQVLGLLMPEEIQVLNFSRHAEIPLDGHAQCLNRPQLRKGLLAFSYEIIDDDQFLVHYQRHDVILGLDMMVQRAHGNAAFPSYIAHRGLEEALSDKESSSRPDNLQPPGDRILIRLASCLAASAPSHTPP
jgi:hypothetical protein